MAQVDPYAILLCSCKSEYQDKKYGKGKRLHNLCGGGSHAVNVEYRCTVCENKRGKKK